MYRLSNQFATNNFTVTVVGCGGTGGFVADGLCRVLPPRAELVLVDHDIVEERNLVRQNFAVDDIPVLRLQIIIPGQLRFLAHDFDQIRQDRSLDCDSHVSPPTEMLIGCKRK